MKHLIGDTSCTSQLVSNLQNPLEVKEGLRGRWVNPPAAALCGILLTNQPINQPDKRMSTFVADLAKVKNWGAFQAAMDEYHDSLQTHLAELAQSLGVSHGCAMDVWYLRQRSRWTPELEQELIALHKQGNPPNINEFGHSLELK